MLDPRTQLLHGQWFRQLPITFQDSLLALGRPAN